MYRVSHCHCWSRTCFKCETASWWNAKQRGNAWEIWLWGWHQFWTLYSLKSLHKVLQIGPPDPLSDVAPRLSTYHYITLSCTWLNLPGLLPLLLFLYIQNWACEGLRAKVNFVKYTYSPSLIPRPVWEWTLWSIHGLILSPHSTVIVTSSTSSCCTASNGMRTGNEATCTIILYVSTH